MICSPSINPTLSILAMSIYYSYILEFSVVNQQLARQADDHASNADLAQEMITYGLLLYPLPRPIWGSILSIMISVRHARS